MSDDSPRLGKTHITLGYAALLAMLLSVMGGVWQLATFKADIVKRMDDDHEDCVKLFDSCWRVSEANEQYHQWAASAEHALPAPSEVMRVTRQEIEWVPNSQGTGLVPIRH